MTTLDTWYANRSTGEVAPFKLSCYDPSKPEPKPSTFLMLMKKGKDDPPWSAALDESEKLRFSISPEVLATTDAAASVIISKTISDTEFAKELTRRYNRSARALLRAENASAKQELSNEAGAYLHDTADLILRNGPSAVTVAAYNRMAGQYIRLCRSVPAHLQRTDSIIADALVSSVRRMGDKIKLGIDLRLALTQSSHNLWKTQSAIRFVLSEHQLEDAQNALSVNGGLALASTSHDPRKNEAGKRERITEWYPELGKCRHCNKNGHLNRDCPTWKKDKDKAKKTADKEKADAAKGDAGHAKLSHGAQLAEFEHTDYTVAPPNCDTEIDIAAFLGGGSQIIELSEPSSGRAHSLVATATAPTRQLVQPNSDDESDQPDQAAISTPKQPAYSPPHTRLNDRLGSRPASGAVPTPLTLTLPAPAATLLSPTLAESTPDEQEPAPQPVVVYEHGDHSRPMADELSMYVITTSTTPGVFYGTFQRPDMLCSIVNGVTPPAGMPATKKIKGSDFATATTVCQRFGIAPVFRGPWTVPDFAGISVGDTITLDAVKAAQAAALAAPAPAAPPPTEDGRDGAEPPPWAHGVRPHKVISVASDADDSGDVTSDDDRDETDLSRAPNGARGGHQITFRLERNEKPPAGSRLVTTDDDGSRTYLYWGNLYRSPPTRLRPRQRDTEPPSSSNFWLGVYPQRSTSSHF